MNFKNFKNFKNLPYLSLALAAVICGCKEEPYVENESASEDYTKAFVQKFGVIDPEQDWNAAATATLVFYPAEDSSGNVDIFVKECDSYYLAARYDEVTYPSRLRFEIPDGVSQLYVAVDGRMYTCTPGGKLDLRAPSRGETGLSRVEYNTPPTDFNNLGWLIAAEDLGSIGDFDFNDFIARIEYDVTSASFGIEPLDWDESDNNVGISRAKSRAAADVKLHVTAMAAGGTLPIWLHFVTPDSKDYVISPKAPNGYILASEMGSKKSTYEWHGWFDKAQGVMVNTTNLRVRGGEVVLPGSLLPDDFVFGDYSYTSSSSADSNIKGFYIEVEHGDKLPNIRLSANPAGAAPQMFLIPDIGWRTSGSYVSGWLWPRERVGIDSAYQKFIDWVGDATGNADWYTQTKSDAAPDVYHRVY